MVSRTWWRRSIIVTSAAGALLMVGLGRECSAAPNIVLLILDDAAPTDLEDVISTGLAPHLADLVADGLGFTRAFVSTPLCCPGRASIETGRHAHNHGVLGINLPDGGAAVYDASNSIAVRLQAAGYRTCMVGKWLNGYGRDTTLFVPPGWDGWYALDGSRPLKQIGFVVFDGSGLRHYRRSYQSRVLGRLAASCAVDVAAPVFLTLSLTAPHNEVANEGCHDTPFRRTIRPHPDHDGLLDGLSLPDKPSRAGLSWHERDCLERHWRDRLEALLAVDDAVGAVRSALGGRETVWILTSDHGWMLGEHGLTGKRWPYDESAGVFLVLSGLGVTGEIDALVSNIDIAPTVLELAGAEPDPDADGRSLMPLIADPEMPWRRRVLIEHLTREHAIVGRYVAIRTDDGALYVDWLDEGREQLFVDELQMEEAGGELKVALRHLARAMRRCAGFVCRALEEAVLPQDSQP